MYRESSHERRTATTIAYRSFRIRPLYLLLGVLLVGLALAWFGSEHVTHVTCERASGACTFRRYAIVDPLETALPLDAIERFDVRVRGRAKGGPYAEVTIVPTPASGRRPLELESGSWADVRPDRALDAQQRFETFRSRLDEPRYEAWLSLGPFQLESVMANIVGAMMGIAGLLGLIEQSRQLRAIRIVVDRAREVAIVGGREIPFDEIRDVQVDFGPALAWSSRRHDGVPGYRLAVHRKSGDAVFATRDHRAGEFETHERARLAVLRAMGRDVP